MKIQAGKTYLTAGEYVVEIINDGGHSSKRTSPGNTICGTKINDILFSKRENGWCYSSYDGSMYGLASEWNAKLIITEELPFSLPDLPEGYTWAGGFPQFRKPEMGDYFVDHSGGPSPYIQNNGKCRITIRATNYTLEGCGGRRLIVAALVEPQKSESSVESSVVLEKPPEVLYYRPSYKDKTLFIKRVGNKLGFVYAGDLNPNLRYNWGTSDEREVREGRWVEITQEDADKIVASLTTPQMPQTDKVASPPSLPILTDGYKFLLSSGEPVFRKPNDGEYFVKYHYLTKTYGPIVKSKDFSVPHGADERRYIVVPTVMPTAQQEKIPVVPQEQPQKTVKDIIFPDPGEGYRLIDKKIDTPQEGDQTFNRFTEKWENRSLYSINKPFGDISHYRRAIPAELPKKTSEQSKTSGAPQEPEDWVEITDLNHIDRNDIDQWTADGITWRQTIEMTNKMSLRKLRERFGENSKYRCLRKHLVVPVAPKEQPKRLVSTVTNNFLTKGESYEVLGEYKPNMTAYKVKVSGGYLSFWSDCFESDISLSDNIVSGADSTKEEEEIIMKKETAIKVANSVTRFAGRWGFKAANYWLFEPAVSMGRPIVKSIRYAVFLGTLGSAIYGYNHPEIVKNAIKSCIPKITIEAPEILNG